MDVRIDRCVLRGPEGAVRRARRVLTNCPWPPTGEAEVLILRRIDVRARPEALPARLYRAADGLIAGGVDGWSEAAAQADCVRFRSEADMLARLSVDLAAGRAAGLWFWQAFRGYGAAGTPARGLGALWLDEAPRVPAVTRILRERRVLAPVWRRVDGVTARALLPRIIGAAAAERLRATTLGGSVPGPAEPPEPASGPDPPGMPGRGIDAALDAFPVPRGAGSAPTDEDLLAMALVVASERPHWIPAPGGARRFAALLGARFRGRGGRGAPAGRAAPSRSPGQEGPAASGDAPPRAPGAGPPEPQRPRPVPSPEPRDGGAGDPVGGAGGARRSDAAPEPAGDPAPGPAPAAEDPGAGPGPGREPGTSGDAWHVAQGGLFYLLNLLNWLPVRERLFADPEAMAFPSAWGWLYRLGEHLDLAPEPPLLHCLAQLSGLPPERFPGDLPPLRGAAEIAGMGAERFARFGIWGPALLRIPARIVHRRPELDVHYALADLDVAVRSAALDVDPGWLDWLGTVVRFHYR